MTEERLKKIVKLSEEQYNTLKSTGTITIEGKVLTYSPTDTIYVTPTLKSFTGVEKDNLLVVYNDDKTRIYCKRILSVPDIQPNTKFDIIFGTTPIQGTLDITVVGKLSNYKNVGSITRHIGVDYQGETASTVVYKDHNYTQVDKSIAQYIFIGDNFEPLTVDSRGLFVTIQNNVKGSELEQSLQNVQVIIEYTGLKTETLDVNWLLNITAGESSAGTISAWDTRPSGYVGSVQNPNRIYGTNEGGGQKTFGINNGGLEYGSDIPRYYNGQIGVSVIPSPLNELQDNLLTTSSIYATVNGGYLQKCVTLKGEAAPTASTQAYYVGQLYLNTTDKTLFKCDSINGSTYTWTAVCENIAKINTSNTTLKSFTGVAISNIFTQVEPIKIRSIKLKFTSDTNFQGCSYDLKTSAAGQTVTNYNEESTPLIATTNEYLYLVRSYSYESNYEFNCGNYKLEWSGSGTPKLSYYGIQNTSASSGAHWIEASTTTDFIVDAVVEIDQ